jgi:hypothetical protein
MFPPNARFTASDILITGTFLALRNHLWEVAVQSRMLAFTQARNRSRKMQMLCLIFADWLGLAP